MQAGYRFEVLARQSGSMARAGRLVTPRGVVETPAFVPVGTQGTVRGLTPAELKASGAQIVLANAYHLYLRPGHELVASLGGLHRFMGWEGPLLTDSGGWQVFSLGFGLEHGVGKVAKLFPDEEDLSPRPRSRGAQRPRLTQVDEDGVTFTSHVDGSIHRMTPELSIQVQEKLGSDIMLAFDECTSPLHDHEYTRQAMERTHRWAVRCLEARTSDHALLGIVQGGAFRDLRETSARFISSLPFDGFAIGGSLGRSKDDMHRVLEWAAPLLPEEAPRHLLGIGEPLDLIETMARGMDLFDCVAPTRLGRHGVLYTPRSILDIKNGQHRKDPRPVQADCACYTCQSFSRAYLHHLFAANELLGHRLATLHNVHFVLDLMRRSREAIVAGCLPDLKAQLLDAQREDALLRPGAL